jgi:GH18 family chitinase
MKKFTKISLLLLFLTATSTIQSQKVSGFFPDWVDPSLLSKVQYSKLTDIFFAFIQPDASGNLSTTTAGSQTTILVPLVTNGHAAGSKVHISIGGANNSGNFSSVVGSASNRTNFVNNVATYIQSNDLDGVNIDWEFPSGADATNLGLMMTELRTKINTLSTTMGRTIEISIAVAPLVWNTDGINSATMDASDFIYLMAFDAKGACCVCDANHHSSYVIAQRTLQKWTTGLATTCGGTATGMAATQSKLVLAIPFYSSHSTYDYFSDFDPAGYYNDADGLKDGYDYNSCPLIQQKTDLIMNTYGGAGIWTWELSQDRTDQYSLQTCMRAAMDPYLCSAPAPNLGSEQSICGSSSVTLNSSVSTSSGRTFTWKKDGATVVSGSSTATTYSATTAGTYTVEVHEGSCFNATSVVITGSIGTVELGAAVELCSPTSSTLNSGQSAAGQTFLWKKDGVTISGATSSTYLASVVGTYEVTVSASGCPSKSDNVVVTSLLPTVTSDTICSAGSANLTSSASADWFNVQTGGAALSTGTTYSPSISTNTTYWVQASGASSTENTTMKSTLNGAWHQTSVYGTKFVVIQELTLKEVTIDADGSAVTINVVQSDGTTVVKTKAFASVSGVSTLALGFTLSPGTYYLNTVGSVSKINVETTSTADYSVAGIISVEGNAYWDWGSPSGAAYIASGHYGVFTNLVVVTGNTCDRVPSYAIIDAGHSSCIVTSAFGVRNTSLSLYPNPSKNEFTLSVESSLVGGLVSVYDLNGQNALRFKVTKDQMTFGKNLNPGVYFLHVKSNDVLKKLKFVKLR